jgi:RNA polymerase sigma-70 factor (ECF subfamily)
VVSQEFMMQLVEQSDALIAVRCQLGDPTAWEVLVERWQSRLWGFIARMVPDEQTAEDVLQTVWLEAVRSLVRLKDPERLAAWLYGIARRRIVDRYRAAYRQPPTEEFNDIAMLDDSIEQTDRTEWLAVSLDLLHPADREAVLLHYYQELPIQEVAEICGVPPGTIKSRLFRARQILRQVLEGEKS